MVLSVPLRSPAVTVLTRTTGGVDVGPYEGDWARAQPVAWPQLAAWLGWLPVASLILGADGAATAVNSAWVAMAERPERDSLGHGWLGAVVPPEREIFGACMRRAAASGVAGRSGCHLAGAVGRRWSRWWWQPAPFGGLVCVAVVDDGQAGIAPAGGITVDLASMLVHRMFGVGLALESVAGLADGPAAARLQRAINELDDLIRDIRAAVFQARQFPMRDDP